MNKISIFIPVFKESKYLENLLKKILRDPYKYKEIFVLIDEPSNNTLSLVKKYQKEIKFIINKKRIGKVNAINKNLDRATGNIILFLDSDIKISQKNFLETIIREINDTDLLDLKKEVIQESFLSKLIQYEYLTYNIVNYILSKKIGESYMINGAGFAVKKEFIKKMGGLPKLIVEDVGLALEVIKNNLKFKFTDKVKIKTGVPNTFKSYFKQRMRWGFGGGEVIREYLFYLKNFILKNSLIVLPTIFLYYPSFIIFILLFISFFNFLLGLYGLIFFLLAILSLLLSFSKKLNIKINFLYLPIYFVYTLFSFFILFFYSIKGFRRKIIRMKWKI